MRARAEQIATLYSDNYETGNPSRLGDPDTVTVLLAAIADGNYRETACSLAGLPKKTFYEWLKKADAGDEAALAFRDALERAEALAESDTVRNVRNASKLPQFWAAGMTWLERKSPEKWGRRSDDSSSPKVIVQIGARDSDVHVAFAPAAPPNALTEGEGERIP